MKRKILKKHLKTTNRKYGKMYRRLSNIPKKTKVPQKDKS